MKMKDVKIEVTGWLGSIDSPGPLFPTALYWIPYPIVITLPYWQSNLETRLLRSVILRKELTSH